MKRDPNDTIPLPPSSLVEKKQLARKYDPAMKTGPGLPGVILSPARTRIIKAQVDADKKRSPLVPAPKTSNDTRLRIKQGPTEWYIEWWKLGTSSRDINCATFVSINIKHFCKVFSKHKHLSMVFLRREMDKKIMYDRRTN